MFMVRSKISGLALAGATAFVCSPALADGMPRRSLKDVPRAPPPFSWTGFYVGVNAGYAWGDSDARFTNDCNVPPGTGVFCSGNVRNAEANAIQASGNQGSLDPDGFIGGVQAGYNWQSGSAVLGVELDFNAFNVNASRSASGVTPLTVSNYNIGSALDTDWLFTARGRLGWIVGPTVLAYVTGGLAVTDIQVSQFYNDNLLAPPGFSTSSTTTSTKTGWTLGGGLEWALTNSWTMKAEYLYVDFGRVSTSGNVTSAAFPGFATPHHTSADLNVHIARVGINYKF